MREQAQAEATRLLDAAHAQIDTDRQQALAALRQQVGELSVELAGRIVGESLTDEARQSRVVDRFLGELESSGEQAAELRSASARRAALSPDRDVPVRDVLDFPMTERR